MRLSLFILIINKYLFEKIGQFVIKPKNISIMTYNILKTYKIFIKTERGRYLCMDTI